MTTVLFVHGTGVRNPEYEETFKLIETTLHLERPDVKVERCLWGDELGTKLNAQGASIPLYDATLALDEEQEDYSIVLVDNKQPFPRSHGAYWTNKARGGD